MNNNLNNKNLGLSLLALVVGMILLAYSSVPLYSLFCKITGYGGTTQQTRKVSTTQGKRIIRVKFDANIKDDLPWAFKPEQKEITVTTGDNAIIFYSVKNLTNKSIIGTSVYNVTPHKAGLYFNKIQCFCFEEQLLSPNQDMTLPVSFFIDPEFDIDPDLLDVDEITLSYTFFRVE